MFDELHNVSMFDRMEPLIDYTANPRKPDPRLIEDFDLIPQTDVDYNNPPECFYDFD